MSPRGFVRGLARWARRVAAATRFAAARRDLWPAALAGFLIRGGIVPLLIAIVVLPSPVGLASSFVVDAVTIAGQPAPGFLLAIAIAVVAIIVWLLVAAFFGAAVDAGLIEAEAEQVLGTPRPQRTPPIDDALILMGIRGVYFAPVAAMLVWLGIVIGITVADDLLLPTSLAGSVYERVIERTVPAIAVTMLVWLLFEAFTALSSRQRVLRGDGFAGCVRRGLLSALTRPITTVLSIAVSFVGSVAAIGIPLYVATLAFDWSRVAARSDPVVVTWLLGGRDVRPLLFVGAILVLAGAWLATLAMAAATSLWRSAIFTNEAIGDLPADTR